MRDRTNRAHVTGTAQPSRLRWVEGRLMELSFWMDRASLELTGWQLDGARITVGDRWPPDGGIIHLEHALVHVPESWPLSEVRLELAAGSDSLLRIDYEGSTASFGVDDGHRWFPLDHRSFRLAVDIVGFVRGTPRPTVCLKAARLVWSEAALEGLLRRLRLIHRLAAALGEEHDLSAMLLRAAGRALAAIDWPSRTDRYVERVARHEMVRLLRTPPSEPTYQAPLPEASRNSLAVARSVLDGELAALRERHPPQGRLLLTGHAHLDLAWLTTIADTTHKLQHTFSTVVSLLERYPTMTFSETSAELYELTREADPELFSRIRQLASDGRWEPIGGMWVEPDMNLVAGESIVRQLLQGQRYFECELGRRSRVCWLADCFGFTAALPQLLLGAGIRAFATTKMSWNDTEPFPYHSFWWEGLDGSRVIAHHFEYYGGGPAPATLMEVWRRYSGRLLHPEALHTIGHLDDGPTAEQLEDVALVSELPEIPAVQFGHVESYFDRLRASADDASTPVWVGELYLQAHRGTFTTQGRTKWLHRRAERDLVAAEVVESLAVLAGNACPRADLTRAWRLLLRNQFHDILPGAGIREVHVQAEDELAEVRRAASEVIGTAMGRLAEKVLRGGRDAVLVLVNPDLSERPLRVVSDRLVPGAQSVVDGWALTGAQPVGGLELVGVTQVPPPARPARAEEWLLENASVRVELAEDGTLRSVLDRRCGRELLAEPCQPLWVFQDKPGQSQAWDVDQAVMELGEPLGTPESMEIVEPGPHRAAIRLRWRYRASSIEQHVRLWANSSRLEFATRLDWHDRRVLLKARFPLALRAPFARFETAFGVVERPTHRNTTWDQAQFEVPCHRFADLAEPDYGVALLNDGRYGCHALGNELGLSLLRTPFDPDPYADEGCHELTYALLPHRRASLVGEVLAEAEDLNRPLLALACREGCEARRRLLSIRGMSLALAALKLGENDNSLVLRLYEPQGSRGSVQPCLPDGWRVSEELDLLEERVGPPDFRFRPFQVRTYRLVGPAR